MPTPRLKVSSSLARGHLAGFGDQVEDRRRRPGRAVDHRVARRPAAPGPGCAASPPPVTWAKACTPHVARPAPGSPGRRSGSGSSSSSPSVRPPSAAGRGVEAAARPARAARAGPASSRWSAARTSPSRSARRPAAPGPGRAPRRRSTTPTPVPERSYSSGSIRPGCSAVSPPTSAQPACTQPSAMPATIVGDLLGHDLAGGDVVGQEQRLGADHDEVVDDHGDQVDADRVVPVERLRDRDLGADAVGRGGQHRLRVPRRGRARTARRSRRGRRAPRAGRCARPRPSSARRRGRRPRCRRRRRRRRRRRCGAVTGASSASARRS